jgi:ribosome biogenesis ATPase
MIVVYSDPRVHVSAQVCYEDLGGIEEVLSDIRELIEYPLKHPEVRGLDGVG